jgi:hypothetical protein
LDPDTYAPPPKELKDPEPTLENVFLRFVAAPEITIGVI